jgi:hypothetical protein
MEFERLLKDTLFAFVTITTISFILIKIYLKSNKDIKEVIIMLLSITFSLSIMLTVGFFWHELGEFIVGPLGKPKGYIWGQSDDVHRMLGGMGALLFFTFAIDAIKKLKCHEK